MAYTTPQTGPQTIKYDTFSGPCKRGYFIERVTFAGNAPSATLGTQIPPRSRIVWSAMKSADAITPRLASTAAATIGQAGIALVATAPTSLAAQTTSALCVLTPQTAFGAAIPANTEVNGFAAQSAAGGGITQIQHLQNTGTTAMSLYILPYAATTGATDATQRYLANTSTATNGYTLGGTSTANLSVDVHVQIETYQNSPTA